MIRFLYILCLSLLIVLPAEAQYQRVIVGVDGFTCSMCGMSVENALRRLPFVEDVQMDLNSNTATIYFRKNTEISIRKIADEVYGSGFSVRSIEADYAFQDLTVHDFSSYQVGKDEFHFLKVGEHTINGVATIIFLNKRLISRKEYSHWEEWIKQDVKKNGKKENVYYVTLLRG
ncbi:MAG TPA: heavy metal-associated domain-containing protein [Cytophagaceae bacterium]|nr:heavy metal-associated domain-containing protein [Cytophagaceae bacterium]